MTEVEQHRGVRYIKYFELYLLFKNCLAFKKMGFFSAYKALSSFATFDYESPCHDS